MAIITVPKALREKLGEEGSDALVEMINHSQDKQKTDMIELVGERFERRLSEEIGGINNRIEQLRAELKEDNASLRAELKQDIAHLQTGFNQDIAHLKTDLKTDIANSRTEMIKWMFIFWVGQTVTILGFLFAFFR